MKFHISDILTVTTGKLVSTRHIEGIYDILNYMTGDDLFTHQLPRARNACKPYLLEQFPFLKSVTGDEADEDNWKDWVQKQVDKFGEQLEVGKIPVNQYNHVDPIREAVEMKNG